MHNIINHVGRYRNNCMAGCYNQREMNNRLLIALGLNKAKKPARRMSAGTRAGAVLTAIIGLTILSFAAAGSAAAVYIYNITSELPRLEKEAVLPPAQTTRIYAADGSLIASLHAEENRLVVKLDDIAPVMQKAVIAIEDERFYEHKGVDPIAILRSLIVDIRTGSPSQGASTITQQYVKNIYLSPEKTIERKIKEAILAYEAEKKYSKNTILEKYLNTVYFGHGCYGVETASQLYFGKKAKDLTLPEAALLAGIIQRPASYSPYNHPEEAIARRNLVLKKMLEQGYITREQYEEAVKAPLEVKEPPEENYFMAPYFVEYVKDFLIDRYGVDRVFKGGLRVYTTLVPEYQKAAEKAVFDTLDRENDPDAALVSIDVETGHILAMVGGRDFKKEKFNLATQGKRQPGSSFKVFVLTAALENGFSPYETYESSPVNIDLPSGPWKVRNAEGGGRGPITIREATIRSVNAVYARLIMDVGPEKVVDVAHRLGITSELKPYPSIALGSEPVSPLEMASAYSSLARGGRRIDPIAVTRVTDPEGNIIDEFKPRSTQAVDEWIAYTVNDILKDVVRRGTGWRARIAWPAAGKTGTAQEYRDAWFVGYTPFISTAVWVGYKEAQISMRNIHGFARVYGGTLPAIIWKKYMEVAMEGKPKDDFPRPDLNENLITVEICVDSGLRATPFCENTRKQIFLKGKAPVEFCDIHRGIELPDLTKMKAADAINYLESKKINYTVVNEYSDTVPEGFVIRHEPGKGTPVPEGGSVRLYVSLGPETSPEPPPPPETTPTTPSP